MPRPRPTHRRVPVALALTLALAAAPVAACGPTRAVGPTDGGAGAPPSGLDYFALAAGRCFEYSAQDGGLPDLGLSTIAIPGGVALHLSRHGQDSQVDYLAFDGGLVLLTGRDRIAGDGVLSRVFATPLDYLEAPLRTGGQSLTSSSAYDETLALLDGGSGRETRDVAVLQEAPWTFADGGPAAFELNIATTDSNATVPAERRWVVPGQGYVDLYLPNDTGTYVDYDLVDSRAAGAPCAAN